MLATPARLLATLVVFASALALGSSHLAAQVGVTPVNPSPGSTSISGRTIVPEQRWSLRSTGVEMSFVKDAKVGIRLDSVSEKPEDLTNGVAAPFFNAPPFSQASPAGLWEIHGTHRDPPLTQGSACDNVGLDEFCIRPNALNFTVVTSAANEIKMIWPDVPIPGAHPGEKSLRVEVTVRLDASDRVSRWWISVKREDGTFTRASIDEIHCPVLWVKPPISNRLTLTGPGGTPQKETEKDAQARARILVPNNNINIGFQGNSTVNTPLLSTNLPLDYWFRKHPNEYFELDHPNPGQLMQFQAIYNADRNDPGFRRMLYLGTEDRVGYKKRFGYRAVSFASKLHMTEPGGTAVPVTDWRWVWRHIYLPSFEDMIDTPGEPNEWGNTFTAPYPAVVGVLKAKSDEFWYDAAAFYRDFVESSGMVPMPLESNPNVSPRFRDQTVFSAHTLVDHTLTSGGASMIPRALSIARAYKEYFEQNFPTSVGSNHYMFVGNYKANQAYGYPDFPVGVPPTQIVPTLQTPAFTDPAIHPTVAQAHAAGIHVSGYTEGLKVTTASQWPLPRPAWLFDRDGNRVATSTICFTDFGNFDADAPTISTWFSQPAGPAGTGMNGLGNLVADACGFRGLYIDGVSGTGFTLGYPNPSNPNALGHLPHGGTYSTEGRRKTLADARAMLKSLPHNVGNEDHVYVMSEAVQEHFVGELDLAMQGLDYVPFHMAFYEPTFFESPISGLGDIEDHMEGVPLASRAWSIPLWNTVYHQYQPSNTLAMAITTAGIDGGPLYPRGNGACFRQGVKPDIWEDMLCYVYAAFWAAGQKPAMIPYVHDFDHTPIWWDNGGLQWDDPTGACGRALDFIGRMHALYVPDDGSRTPEWAGRFNLYGKAQRPLRTVAEQVPTQGNPTFLPYYNTNASLPASCDAPSDSADHSTVVLPYIEQSVNAHAVLAHVLDQPVPAVLHSVWRHDTFAGPIPVGQATPPPLGILLANWTDQPQAFQGSFVPSLYGIAAGTTYTIREVDAFGQTIQTLGSAAAPQPMSVQITLPARNDPANRRACTVLVVDV